MHTLWGWWAYFINVVKGSRILRSVGVFGGVSVLVPCAVKNEV